MGWSREVQAMVALLRSFGLPHRITDVDTPNIHSRGSYHYQAGTGGHGLAIDVAGPIPYGADPAGSKAAMLAICARLVPYHEHLAELICSHLPYSVKNGRKVGRYAVSAHYNHVHLAVRKGVFLYQPPTDEPVEVTVVPDNPELLNLEGPLTFHLLQDQNGICTGYAFFGTMTGELHGYGPGWRYYGRSEDPTPDDEQ